MHVLDQPEDTDPRLKGVAGALKEVEVGKSSDEFMATASHRQVDHQTVADSRPPIGVHGV